jgi:hypothetical protein
MSILKSSDIPTDPNSVVVSNLQAGDFGFCPTPLSKGLERTIAQQIGT